MVTKINLPNSAAIVGLVDPSEAIPYDMTVSVSALGKEGECGDAHAHTCALRVFALQYDGPPARGVLVEDTTKDQEDRKREEERLRASRPGTASRPASVAGGAGAGAGAGASLAAAAANLVGENSGTAVLRALGDKVCSRCQEGVCVAVSLIRFLCCRHPLSGEEADGGRAEEPAQVPHRPCSQEQQIRGCMCLVVGAGVAVQCPRC